MKAPRCARCHRALSAEPAATVATRDGLVSYGPVCAAKLGLLGRIERESHARIVTPSRRRAKLDPDQLDWIGAPA